MTGTLQQIIPEKLTTDFEIFKTRFGLRGTFLDFQSLIRKIPNRWKSTLNNNKNICIINKFNIKCNVYVKLGLKDKKGFMIS